MISAVRLAPRTLRRPTSVALSGPGGSEIHEIHTGQHQDQHPNRCRNRHARLNESGGSRFRGEEVEQRGSELGGALDVG